MARIARVIAPGYPHHITQRGNRRQQTFFCDNDYKTYKDLMSEWCKKHKVEIWAYCLMPNHVYMVVVPESEEGLRTAIGEAHRRYTRYVNFREGWRGHLWQGRFASFPMDESYLFSKELRKHERIGRPLGSESFIKKLERTLDRPLHK